MNHFRQSVNNIHRFHRIVKNKIFHSKLQINLTGRLIRSEPRTAFLPGGPFDLMSRRLIVASSKTVAERITRALKEFDVGRDDV